MTVRNAASPPRADPPWRLVHRIDCDELVAAIVGRLPATLAEVRDLLTDQQRDYAEFLTGNADAVPATTEEFIARLVSTAARDPSTMVSSPASGLEPAFFEQIGRMQHQQN